MMPHRFSTLTRLALPTLGLFALVAGCASAKESAGASADQVSTPTTGVSAPGTEAAADLPASWPNRGSSDCTSHANSEPNIYKFKLNADTFILRENKCFNYEGNFIYVIFGHDKVLMQDTGSIPQGTGVLLALPHDVPLPGASRADLFSVVVRDGRETGVGHTFTWHVGV